MIKFEAIEVFGWEAAIRGMRNSWGSHEKSDSGYIPMIATWSQDRAEQVYTLDDDTCTREREMLIKGKRFIISSVFPVKAKATATDRMLALIDADLQKDAKSFLIFP